MKSNRSSISLGALIFFASSAALWSQDSSRVSCRVDVISIGEDITGLKLRSGSGRPSVKAKSFVYSQSVKYSGSRVMEITQSGEQAKPEEVDLEKHPDAALPLMPRKNKDGKLVAQKSTFLKAILERREKTPDLVALAVIPANAKRVTVLMAPAAEGTYRTYVFNDNLDSLPYGRARILNLCSHPVALSISGSGKKSVILPQYKSLDRIKPVNKYVRYQLGYPCTDKRTGEKCFKSQASYMERVSADDQVQIVIVRSNASFFQSSSGGCGDTLQLAILRRNKMQPKWNPEQVPAAEE